MNTISKREAISILMLSPLYFRWPPAERLLMVNAYMMDFNAT